VIRLKVLTFGMDYWMLDFSATRAKLKSEINNYLYFEDCQNH